MTTFNTSGYTSADGYSIDSLDVYASQVANDSHPCIARLSNNFNITIEELVAFNANCISPYNPSDTLSPTAISRIDSMTKLNQCLNYGTFQSFEKQISHFFKMMISVKPFREKNSETALAILYAKCLEKGINLTISENKMYKLVLDILNNTVDDEYIVSTIFF